MPKLYGGTTTPDFVFAIQKDKTKRIYILLEAKSKDKRDSEKIATKAQDKFFNDSINHSLKKIMQKDDTKTGQNDTSFLWQEVISAEDVQKILEEYE